MIDVPVAGSFRDPAGFMFRRGGIFHRHVTPVGLPSYRQMMSSGLYAALVSQHVLIPHDDIGPDPGQVGTVLLPRQVPMISYPYEWSLSQLRDAALVTLQAQRLALRFGMTLKDASAYNVQFVDGRPALIDTLSFAPHDGGPWVAYRQFCQHFYGPLLLGATRDVRLLGLTRQFIDGVPLGLVSRLLSPFSYLRPGALLHVHLHARAESALARGTPHASGTPRAASSGDSRVEALVGSLERGVNGVSWSSRSVWSEYYAERESYAAEAFIHKARVVGEWLERSRPGVVWDLGANTGHFSRMAAAGGAATVAFDSDAACIDALYREGRRESGPSRILPLVLDLTNPSSAMGWAHQERLNLESRGPADLLLVLAVIHHLAIGNNVPLPAIAGYLARLGRRAIIEFVPKSDSMVQGMLKSRADIFTHYDEAGFEQAFGRVFTIDERVALTPSSRSLYLMSAR